MTAPTLTDRLAALGDALEAAARRDLAAQAPARPRARRRRLLVVGLAAALAAPVAAYAAVRLTSPEDVARSMPAGTLSLAGTEPTCTVVVEDVEFSCTLARAPAPEVADWTGTVEPTVDATGHVNGGCRSLDAAGMTWTCYLGAAAVDQQIVDAGFLGEAVSGPGVG